MVDDHISFGSAEGNSSETVQKVSFYCKEVEQKV